MDETAPPLPPVVSRREVVLGAGVATSALALLGVYLLNKHVEDFNIMGWYANYVIPAGALIVGLAAGSGYGVASWVTGVKITRGLLWTVVALQGVVYLVAQYVEFASLHLTYDTGDPVSFGTYFDFVTRSFAWKGKGDAPGDPLGAWGYALRALEVIGFAGGGVLAPAALSAKPYCERCQVYMRTRRLGLLPAGIAPRKVKKSDAGGQAAFAEENEAAFKKGRDLAEGALKHAAEGRARELEDALAAHVQDQRSIGKLTQRIAIELSACGRCRHGFVAALAHLGHGNEVTVTKLAAVDVGPEIVDGLAVSTR